MSNTKRFRCTQCDAIVEESRLVPAPGIDLIKVAAKATDPNDVESLATIEKMLSRRYHKRWQKLFSRSELRECGPVEVEQVSEFVEQFEHFIGETV